MTRIVRRQPTERRRRFVEEFLMRDNASAAAIAAGFAPRWARNQGNKLLRDPWVAQAIRHKLDARAERTRIAADRIVLELARIAFSDIARIAAWNEAEQRFQPRPLDTLSESDRAAIARIGGRRGEVKIQLHDKIRALDALGKYFKLWGKQADKFAPRVFGEAGARGGGGDAPNGDYTNAMQRRVRELVRERIRQVVTEDKLKEEAEWAAAWREKFG